MNDFVKNSTLVKQVNEQILIELSSMCIKEITNAKQTNIISSECIEFMNVTNYTLLIQLIQENYEQQYSDLIPNTSFHYDHSWWITLSWTLLFSSMELFAVVSNLLIIWIISSQKTMRTIINLFLLNLTISDLFTITFNASFNFIFMLNGHWPFGKFYCTANNFITNLTIASSVFTIMVTSIER